MTNPEIAPVAIGGVGGSGTRLVAQILIQLGFNLGEHLNQALDNKWFSFLFKRHRLFGKLSDQTDFDMSVAVFLSATFGGDPLESFHITWLRREFGNGELTNRKIIALIESSRREKRSPTPWGWKEPNTHLFIDRIDTSFPGIRYIHVVRNGLDMAFSDNQNQLRNWGRYFLKDVDLRLANVPQASLKYWCAVHRRVLNLATKLNSRFFWLDFDNFCLDPSTGLQQLAKFLDIGLTNESSVTLSALIHPPDSIGRFRNQRMKDFDKRDVDYVQSLGFNVRY